MSDYDKGTMHPALPTIQCMLVLKWSVYVSLIDACNTLEWIGLTAACEKFSMFAFFAI